MSRYFLLAGGILNISLAIFKIAMPHLFRWEDAMGASESFMWSTVYAENLAISLLLLFFAYMSIVQTQQLMSTSLGKTVLLAISALWALRAAAEVFLFRIGEDGAWWRLILFGGATTLYLLPLLVSIRDRQRMAEPSRNNANAEGTT